MTACTAPHGVLQEMVEYPWDLKDPRALLRAAVQVGGVLDSWEAGSTAHAGAVGCLPVAWLSSSVLSQAPRMVK